MIKIESNIPIPKPKTNYKEVLFNMEVGQCLTTEKKHYPTVCYAAKVLGYKITMRSQYGQMRIWLLSK